MNCAAVVRRFASFIQTIVTHDAGYTQTVVFKNTIAPLPLCYPMRWQVAPFTHRIVVAPERERKQFVGIGGPLTLFQ